MKYLLLICNVVILLSGLSIGLYALHLGHPIYAGLCVLFGWLGMMGFKSKPEESKDEHSN